MPEASVGGNLLGYIRCGNQLFRIGNIIILYKQHLQPVFGVRVAVDLLCNLIDILNDPFGPVITRGRFGAKEKNSRMPAVQAAILQRKIGIQNGKGV